MDELRGQIHQQSRQEARWKHRFVAMGIVATVLAAGVVAAVSVNQNTYYGAQGETNTYDTSVFSLSSLGNLPALLTSAAGTTNSFAGAVEMSLVGGTANTALPLGDWTYQAKLQEAGINTFPQSATAYYKVELFVDGTSQGALYVKNAVGDALNVEQVTLKWDIGANLPTSAAYTVKVTQMAS